MATTTFKIMDGNLCCEKGLEDKEDAILKAQHCVEKDDSVTVYNEQTSEIIAIITNATIVDRK